MKFDTKTIHPSKKEKTFCNALNSPIAMSSTFTFDSIDDVQKVMSFQSDDFVYTRGNNPTLRELENKLSLLEDGAGAVAFASGMAAISCVLLSLLSPNDELIAHRTLYGSAHSVINKLLPKYKIVPKIRDLTDLSLLQKAITPKTKVIYFETPANPNLDVIDIREICQIAQDAKIAVVIDNTFATPYLTKPLNLGADVVVHSASKYLCGHGDAIGGIAVAKDTEYLADLKFNYMCELGGVLSPFNAFLILRGIKTLGLRMEKHCSSAQKVAEFLTNHPKVEKVIYPGLPSFAYHQLAKEQMCNMFGGIVSFEVKGGLSAAQKLANNIELFKLAVSLGDCESLIEVPAAMTHFCYPQHELANFGLTSSMVRLSIGLEDPTDLIDALKKALSNI